MKRTLYAAFSLGILVVLHSFAAAQDAKTLLFQEADEAAEKAKAVQASFFSPNQFQTAVDNYRKADEDFKAGKNMEDIKKKLKMSAVYYLKAAETTKEAQTLFKDCVKARNDAMLVESPTLRKELWNEAESVLSQACKQLEENDPNARPSSSPSRRIT
jgi:hypothetical protein